MNSLCLEHVSEELLDRYLTQQGSETDIEVVETHLLICDSCQDRLDDLENYRSAMRAGFALLASEEEQLLAALAQARGPRRAAPHRWSLLRWSPSWAMLPVAALLALAAIVVVPSIRRAVGPVDVQLTVERGSETTVAAPQGRSLHLRLDSAGLPEGQVSVEIVDSTGNVVNTQQAVARSNQVTIGVSNLSSGLYYVRIYSSKDGRLDPDRLLREFTLPVK